MKPDSPYVVLARKYRPLSFGEVVGQEAVSVTLQNALSTARLAHAYLFTGPRGVGKTTMARLLAKSLNCVQGLAPSPCLRCDSCREVAHSSSLDVLEMDAASHTGVDNVREVIVETVALAPSRDRYKVFIIDEAHMLSNAAFNALLKTLEEPPPHVVFILATTEAARIPATVASRCQRFRFRPIPSETIAAHLGELVGREKIAADPEALELLAKSSSGSLRDAVSLLDQAHTYSAKKLTAESVREMMGFVPAEILLGAGGALLEKDALTLSRWLKTLYDQGHEPAQFLRGLREAFEAVYLAKLGVGPLPSAWAGASRDLSAPALGSLVRRINRALEELRVSDAPRLTLELALFSSLEAAGDLQQWVERLEELEKRLSLAEPGPRAGGRPAVSVPSSHPPAPAPAVSALSGEIGPEECAKWWQAAIVALSEKPALAASLQGALLEPAEQGGWLLRLRGDFECKAAERNKTAIEAILATVSGRKLSLTVGLRAPVAGALEEVVDSGMPESGGPPMAGSVWRDVTEGGGPAPETPLTNAEKIMGGKVKFVKKK